MWMCGEVEKLEDKDEDCDGVKQGNEGLEEDELGE